MAGGSSTHPFEALDVQYRRLPAMWICGCNEPPKSSMWRRLSLGPLLDATERSSNNATTHVEDGSFNFNLKADPCFVLDPFSLGYNLQLAERRVSDTINAFVAVGQRGSKACFSQGLNCNQYARCIMNTHIRSLLDKALYL